MATLFLDYSFWTVALGTMLFALATSMLGTITVLTGQSLIGDTLAHASYPGVIFAFMVFQSRNPLFLMLGAILTGYLSYVLVYLISHFSQHSFLNSLSLVSVSFFSLGMILKQYIQGNANFKGASQAGLATYLFGQAAFIKQDDLLLVLLISSLSLILFALAYQAYKIYLFDPIFARTQGVSVSFLNHMTRFLMISLIAVGLKLVGAVLMSSFLIAPASIGLLCSKHYSQTLFIAALSSIFAAFIGTLVSSIISGLATGPSIIVVMVLLFLLVFIGKTRLSRGGYHV